MKLKIFLAKLFLLYPLLLIPTTAKEDILGKLENQTKKILQTILPENIELKEKLLEQLLKMHKDVLCKEPKKQDELIILGHAIYQAKEMVKAKSKDRKNIEELLNKIEYELIKKARYIKGELQIEQSTVEQIVEKAFEITNDKGKSWKRKPLF